MSLGKLYGDHLPDPPRRSERWRWWLALSMIGLLLALVSALVLASTRG